MFRIGKKFSKPELSRVINGDIKINDSQDLIKKERLDILLKQQYPGYKRATLQKFIKMGAVKVNNEIDLKPNSLIREGSIIELVEPNFEQGVDLKRDVEVIYEDINVKVLNKPAGLLSMQKGELKTEPTLEDFGYLVHRLDRDTSGVVILAKNEEVRGLLQKQFQDRKVKKKYIAVVCGHLKMKEARIELPIARNLKRPTTFDVDANGKEAITEYRVLAENEKYSLVELNLLTGRTHQIRVHMKYLGTPILGDEVYGGETAERLFLHAESLEISIPGEEHRIRKTFTVKAPEEFIEKTKNEHTE